MKKELARKSKRIDARRGRPAFRAPHRQLAHAGYAYAALFEKAEEGGYIVRFPAFGDLITCGNTLDDARAMAVDCLQGHIDWLLKEGVELPRSDVAAGLPKLEVVRVKPKAA